jgi:hypothetical protein
MSASDIFLSPAIAACIFSCMAFMSASDIFLSPEAIIFSCMAFMSALPFMQGQSIVAGAVVAAAGLAGACLGVVVACWAASVPMARMATVAVARMLLRFMMSPLK